jgi:quercetin dioxygenase-like cupin family protein
MPVHADLRQRVAIATPEMPWAACGDTFEKLLEDAPGPRRTAIVHAPAGARFRCVDALILDGPGAGRYFHEGELVTDTACTLFVKARPSRDRSPLEIDIQQLRFEPHHTPGLSFATLHEEDDGARVVLLHFEAGTYIDTHVHARGEEFFVLDGEVTDELGTYTPGAWVRQPPGSAHSIESRTGCLFLTFADHLM